jgi:hypothetical protein
MGKCKVIPFKKPQPQPKINIFRRILHKLILIGKQDPKRDCVIVRGFGPGAFRSSGRS